MNNVDLPPHRLQVALMQPQIAPNTGNVARLCVATGTHLHLVRPLGFVLSDQKLRRSAMDYWPRLRVAVHDDDEAFFGSIGGGGVWLLTSKGGRSIWDADFADGDVLIFGNESRGLSDAVRGRFVGERQLRIPQAVGERCLNLSTAVGVVLYEAMRRISSSSNGT